MPRLIRPHRGYPREVVAMVEAESGRWALEEELFKLAERLLAAHVSQEQRCPGHPRGLEPTPAPGPTRRRWR